MTEKLHLKAAHHVAGSMTLPGSKSISNRTLLLAALAHGTTQIFDLLDSDDTARMLDSLKALGVRIDQTDTNNYCVYGVNGAFKVKSADLFLGNAGTAFRPLTAALAMSNGYYSLSGVARMHERPIGDLVDALRQAGAHIEYMGNAGFPPLNILPASPQTHHLANKNNANNTTPSKETIKIRGDVSSQFLTALLMALPLTGEAFTIEVVGELISKPYIEITLNLMARFGVTIKRDFEHEHPLNHGQRFEIPANSAYNSPDKIIVEGDASSASYFLAAGAIAGKLKVEGIGQNSIQGDIKFADALAQMGATIEFGANYVQATKPSNGGLKAIDLDCNHIPDAAMTLAILALFVQGDTDAKRTTTLRNIASWRVKETDRLNAMAIELRKVGATVIEGSDFITITPPTVLTPNASIDTYDDHRMAMCFSLVSLAGVPITINDPKCVNKTFPDYFKQFASIIKD